MRKIAIVGAGQSGLQLALGLQQAGYGVTVVSNRSPGEVEQGRVLSSQCMFDGSLQTERDLGLDFWADECPDIEAVGLVIGGPDGGKAVEWVERLTAPARSVDQRVKMPRWMREFAARGGELVFAEAGAAELEELNEGHDLVVVASGKGELGALFPRDDERSPYHQPQRALALTYVTGMEPRSDLPAVTFNLLPGIGEYFWFPALTTSGPCDIMVFEAVPGGPMDCWHDVAGPADHLARSKSVVEQLMPWEAERAENIALTDDGGVLAGRFAPMVRRPVGALPSGGRVLGMADAVVLNDPITGQGSNNAAKCAAVYLNAILEHGDGAFDEDWMEQTFDRFWDYAQYVTQWTNLLLAPPEPHVVELLGAAGANPSLASRIVNGFDNPPDYFPWWTDPAEAERLMSSPALYAGSRARDPVHPV